MTDPPHAQSHPTHRSFFSRHRDLGAAIVSGFVGALALASSTYNVYLQRQQVRAQVWPYIALDTDFDNDSFTLRVSNRGVGPAAIKRVRVLVDEKPARDWLEVLARTLHKKSFLYLPEMAAIEDIVMSPGMEVPTLRIRNSDDAREMMADADRRVIEICYCSTLGDCWLFTSGQKDTTVPTPACTPDPEPFQAIGKDTLAKILVKMKEQRAQEADGGAGGSKGGDGGGDAGH